MWGTSEWHIFNVVRVDGDIMSFDEGMKLFKTSNYRAAAEQFASVTELDENNHKAWNALGICLSKTGEYESAATCFDNARAIVPENATYKKNQAGNAGKIQKEPDLELENEPPKRTIPVSNSGYQRNWWQVPLYFIPMVCAIINPVFGFLVVIACAWYIKYDADSLNAGSNMNGSAWGKLKGWEWMLLLIFFWILMPVYSWKRQQVYEENLGYGTGTQGISSKSEDRVWKYVKYVGGFLICILVIAFASMAMNPSYSSSLKAGYTDEMNKAQDTGQSFSNGVQAAPIATTVPVKVFTSSPIPEPTPITFHGWGSTATELTSFHSGLIKIQMDHYGEKNFIVWLMDENGKKIELLANDIGPYHGSKATHISHSGKYLFDITAGGEYSVKVSQ
jgi:hypothetical protein